MQTRFATAILASAFGAGLLLAGPVPASAQINDIFKRGLEKLGGGGKSGTAPEGDAAASADISAGLREALRIGAERAVATVGQPGGYVNDREIQIPLPGPIERMRQPFAIIGAASVLDDLQLRMNRAAEKAAPKTLNIITDAISEMTIDDARAILTGPDDAATAYLARTASPELKAEIRPIVGSELRTAGAVKALAEVQTGLSRLPMGGSVPTFDLVDFTVDKALKGLFVYLGKEEAAIRKDPAARTTDLLKQVFGG